MVAGLPLVACQLAIADEVIPRLVAASVVLTHVRAAPREGGQHQGKEPYWELEGGVLFDRLQSQLLRAPEPSETHLT